jgi:hypothetical protein
VSDDDGIDGTYSVGLDGELVVLVVDGAKTVVRVRLPAREARRMATLLLAACDVVEGDDIDDLVDRWRS